MPLPAFSVAATTAAFGGNGATAAVVNRLLAKRGRDTFATPADMAEAVFGDSSKVLLALQALAALTILGALAATLAGVFQIIRGDRGGIGLTLGGAYGLVGLLAAMTVVL